MAGHSCNDCQELISSMLDGDISREENARLRLHLATCDECRRTLDAYRQIGGSIRELPAVHPPHHLTESIFAQTIDAEPRRLFLITSRLSYSLAAVAAIMLIFVVAGYLIIGGYERGMDPEVTGSEPPQQQLSAAQSPEPPIWPSQKPVEIEFNKQMNHESVEAALGIQPETERERLSLTWDSNTLIIGEGTPFRNGVLYEIKISTDATDRWGNQLSQPFELTFKASDSVTTIQTPTPGAPLTPTSEATIVSPTGTSLATESPGASTPTPGDNTPAGPTATTGNNSLPGNGNGTPVAPVDPNVPAEPGDPDPTATTPHATSTPTPTEPAGNTDPTSTPSPSPTVTNTPVPPTPTVTATATAQPPTPTVTPISTPASIPVVGAIGDVYWRDQTVQDRLGKAVAAEFPFATNQLDFQRGVMLIDESETSIYVLKFGAGWDSFTIPSAGYPDVVELPEGGLFTPGGAFGALWQSDTTIQDDIGYALSGQPTSYGATAQRFEFGVMIATQTTVYVVYDNQTWDWFTSS